MTIEFREATQADVVSMADRLRESDRKELVLSSGADVLRTLTLSLEASRETLCAACGGVPVMLAGVSLVGGLGVPWMVATPEAMKYRKRLLKDALPVVQQWLLEYEVLTNFVHAENASSIRWLRWLGFTIGDLVPEYGEGKAPFFHFYMVPSNV